MSEDIGAEGIGASPLPPSRIAPTGDADTVDTTAAATPDTTAATAADAAATAPEESAAADSPFEAPAPPRPAASTFTDEEAVPDTEPDAPLGRPSTPLLAGAAFTGLLLIAAPFASAGGPQVLLGNATAEQDPSVFSPWSLQGQENTGVGGVGALGAGGESGGGNGFVPQPLAPVASDEPEDEEADGGGDGGASGDGGGGGFSPRHPWANAEQGPPEGVAGDEDGGEEEAGGEATEEDQGGEDDTVTAAAGDEDDAVVTLSGEEHAKLLGEPGDGQGSESSDGDESGGGSSDDSPVTTAAAEDGGSGSSGSGSSGSGSSGNSGSGGGGSASGPAYSGITGPGCKSDDRTYFWAYNTWYDDPVNSWATRSSGYTKDGCDGLYQAIPVSGDRHNGSGPSTAWTFTPGWAGSHCEVWVYIPNDETPLWISNGPAKYMINSGGSPGAPFTQTELVQSNVKGTWTKIAEFDAPTEQFTVQLVNSGENKASGQGTAHVASSPMRANCS
ncbi:MULTISPECIES: hypothetical protein [unclassified Nocardiopsis]|uniref:hypothetical protein n=1 Tax=Nocardiopsis TaxID=2013 RepID=UPI00387AC346